MNRLGREISLHHVCPPCNVADDRLDTIYSMYGCFYNMSTRNAASLEAGVEDILEYQDTQSTSIFEIELIVDEIRQTLVDFRNGVAQISQRLVTKPEGSRGGTPQSGR
jgi:hypothetical protein